ncbi:toxin-antitoxin system, toxin component, RelE domain protein [delta proteobacterium NaphS2]|nr:toxin-antitoxin system, toxin component, RelE domain protein [delta proteobacterium NaphS2]
MEFDLKMGKPENKILVFRARPYPQEQSVRVLLNGKDIGNIDAKSGWQEYRLGVDLGN